VNLSASINFPEFINLNLAKIISVLSNSIVFSLKWTSWWLYLKFLPWTSIEYSLLSGKSLKVTKLVVNFLESVINLAGF
jgi:hypothetical protein